MGMIDELTSLFRKGPELVSQFDAVKLNTKSVAHGAQDATFQFPILISNTIPIDMASTIARTMERTYVVFTQSWLSMNQYVDITMDRNIVQYLKRFHQNVKLESVMKDLLVDDNKVSTYLEKVDNDEYVMFTNKDKTFGVLFNKADKATRTLVESNKELLKDYLYKFDLKAIPNVGQTIMEGPDDLTSGDLASAIINNRIKEHDADLRDRDIKNTSMNRPPQILYDKDIKKANDIAPYPIQVRLMAVNDKKEFVQFIDFILGVKTVLHAISSDDIIENVDRVMRNQSPLFKFLRWTTGEISLVKNLILNLDDIKADVINKSSGRSPWFNKLKRMKDRRFVMNDFTVPHALIPNSTLVLSAYEVDYLKSHDAINLEDPRITRKLIHSLFLMAVIIVDEGTGTVDILYDGSTEYETYSLETLEREVSMNSNKLGREIGRMISH